MLYNNINNTHKSNLSLQGQEQAANSRGRPAGYAWLGATNIAVAEAVALE